MAIVPLVPAQSSDWPGFLYDLQHSSHNTQATAITPANAATLVEDWSFEDPQPTFNRQPKASIYAAPTVVNGVVYVGSNTGNFFALDEATGTVLWQQLLGYVVAYTCGSGHGVVSEATYANDPVTGAPTLYVGGGDGYLYALDPADGSILFRQFVVDVGNQRNTGFIWAAPTIVNGKIYLGYASTCDNPLVPSAIMSFDQHTGTLLKTFRTGTKGTIGAGVWSTAVSDGKSIWITTGNGTAEHSYAMIQLDGNTLKLRSEWVNPAGTDDLDWGSSPVLFTAKVNNKKTQLVGASGKDGVFHVLDATHLNNGPIWSYDIGTTADFTIGTCLAAPIWDSTSKMLFVASNLTTIGDQQYSGAVRAFDPGTGAIIWETGVNGGPVMGSPTLNGSGVLAAGTYNKNDFTTNAVYLLDEATGNILATIPEPEGVVFGQPVFAGNHLFVTAAEAPTTSLGRLRAFIPAALKAAKKR